MDLVPLASAGGTLRSVGGVGCPVDAWNVGACEGDGGAVDGEGVGLVWGAVEEGLLEQVFKGAFGGKVALEVSVEAIGDVGGVGVLGACKVGDGFACGGEELGEGELLVGAFGFGSCGVEGCVADDPAAVLLCNEPRMVTGRYNPAYGRGGSISPACASLLREETVCDCTRL